MNAPSESPPSVSVVTDWSFIRGNIPEMQWLVPYWLPAGRLTLFTGMGGVGKSRLSLQLAATLASGTREWLGPSGPKATTDHPLPVLYVSWEDDAPEIARRLRRMDADPDMMGRRLAFMDVAEAGPTWVSGPDGGNTAIADWMVGAAGDTSAQLVVIDPLAAAFAGNENDRAEVRAFVTAWDKWARDTGCAVLVISHPPKYGDASYSGSTDWWNAARAVWRMRPPTEKEAEADPDALPVLEVLKSNYAPKPSPVTIETPHNAPWTAAPMTPDNGPPP